MNRVKTLLLSLLVAFTGLAWGCNVSARAPADGARILLGAFGAGLTWCAALLEWGVPVHTSKEAYSWNPQFSSGERTYA